MLFQCILIAKYTFLNAQRRRPVQDTFVWSNRIVQWTAWLHRKKVEHTDLYNARAGAEGGRSNDIRGRRLSHFQEVRQIDESQIFLF